MTRQYVIRLATPANDMAQEEIQKQIAFLARGIERVRFSDAGAALEFDAPDDAPTNLAERARELAQMVQRGLRSLERKVVYRSSTADRPQFHGSGMSSGVIGLGPGQVALEGTPLRLYRYFDAAFEKLGKAWDARPVLTPTLIPSRVLARCDYFRSFPNSVTFACHLPEDVEIINDFRVRHESRGELDERALTDMQTPEACLSPAVCYHVYHINHDRVLPASGLAYGVCGRCFRYESTNVRDLRRLWDFTMREIVFLGTREWVLERRQRSIDSVARFLEQHDMAGEIRTASDPFFVAPDAIAKTYFQLTSETKYEISLMLPDGERLAVGSHNYHGDFFGRAFNIGVEGGEAMHSVCAAFGLERWVCAFLAQHGEDPASWPAAMRQAGA